MGIWKRWTRSGGEPEPGEPGPGEPYSSEPDPSAAGPEEPRRGPDSAGEPWEPPRPPLEAGEGGRGISGWLEKRAKRVVREAYETHAGDLEERAHRVVRTVYEKSADDLEERAVRAMRRAIEAEAGRIQQAIEHGIAVKKREVRLSLIVLVVSSLVYLALYWFTHAPEAP